MNKRIFWFPILLLVNCGSAEPDYKVRGIWIYQSEAGHPTKACMKAALRWLDEAYTCVDVKLKPQRAIQEIRWVDKSWKMESRSCQLYCEGNPEDCEYNKKTKLWSCLVSGSTVLYGQYYLQVRWYSGLTPSAFLHEWNHIALRNRDGVADPHHVDPSWDCVNKLKSLPVLEECEE